jgi:hypothetical protein
VVLLLGSPWRRGVIEPSPVPSGEARGERGDAHVAAPPVLPQDLSIDGLEDGMIIITEREGIFYIAIVNVPQIADSARLSARRGYSPTEHRMSASDRW